MATSPHEPLDYDSVPLQQNVDQIRLLRIYDQDTEELSIRCKLEVFGLASTPPYVALSYVWGGSTKQYRVSCNYRGDVSITDNLYQALRRLRQKTLRSRCPSPDQDDEDDPDIILTWFVSITGSTSAINFGIFAVLSWFDSQHAKAQANAANLLSLAAICAQVNNGATNQQMQAICGPFFHSAWPNLSAAVGGFLPCAPTAAPGSPSSFPWSIHIPPYSSSLPHPGEPSSSFAMPTSSGVIGQPSGSPSGGVSSTLQSAPHTTPPPTNGPGTGRVGGVSLGTHEKLALGIGLGIGSVALLVSALTYWKIQRRR